MFSLDNMHFLLVVGMLLYPGVLQTKWGRKFTGRLLGRVSGWHRKQENPGCGIVSFWDPRTVPKEERQGGLGVLQVGMETGSPEFKQAGQRSPKIRWLAPRTQIAWGSHHRPKHPLVDSISFPYKESRVTNWQRSAARKASLASRLTHQGSITVSTHPESYRTDRTPAASRGLYQIPERQGSLSSPEALCTYQRGYSWLLGCF